jgi:Spy/CpxP family protein refolding chaperone
MIRHLVWFVLVLSLLFNAFFAVGYVKAQRALAATTVEPPAEPAAIASSEMARRVARELSLDERQAAVFERLHAGLEDDVAVFRDAIETTERELRTLLDEPAPDPERVRVLMERRAELEQQRRLAATDRFGEFIGVLTPEQCRRLAHRMFREGDRHGRKRERLLKRFDANEDGELDETERAEAEAFMAEQHQQRRRRFEEMRARFDADGDGELSPEEREAMRQWRLENHPNGRGGRGGRGRGGQGRGPGGDRRGGGWRQGD